MALPWFSIFVGLLGLTVFYTCYYNPPMVTCEHSLDALSLNESLYEGFSWPGECFFSASYFDARSRFREAVKKAGGDLHTYPLDVSTAHSTLDTDFTDDLSLDVGVFNIATKEQGKAVLLHLSGVHGVEGFAGSSIQLALLEHMRQYPHLYPLKKPSVTEGEHQGGEGEGEIKIIFVHTVNPFGMANKRRVNENNVDLNRNFLVEEELEYGKRRDPDITGYKKLYDVINPPSPFPFPHPFLNDLYSWFSVIKNVIDHGMGSLKMALVGGQYYTARGIGYGGEAIQPSVLTIKQILKEQGLWDEDVERTEQPTVDTFAMIDVHTGLGPSGVDTLLHTAKPDQEPSEDKQVDLSAVFVGSKSESAFQEGDNEVAKGYEHTIGATDGFCTLHLMKASKGRAICVTQEFGTVPAVLVGKASMEEMAASVRVLEHPGDEEGKKNVAFYRRRYQGSFFLHYSKKWMQSVVARGVRVFDQGFSFLKEELAKSS